MNAPSKTITAGAAKWCFFTEAWRAVATAKLDEFACQCERLATLADCGAVNRSEAATVLVDIAEANSLGDTFGSEYIDEIMSDAFRESAVADAAE